MFEQIDYNADGSISTVSAYNDTLLEYGMYKLYQVYYNSRMSEYFVLPEYAYERY